MVGRAFVEAVRELPDIRLILLGDGSQREMIHEIIASSGVSDKVYFGGLIDQKNLPEYYQTADLYLSASYSDGASVSLMEALASGLPTLVSDIPCNQEWIKEGENGWLFKVGDVEDLKRKISRIYDKREKLSEMRKQSRLTAENKADWLLNFQKLLQAYQKVLSN